MNKLIIFKAGAIAFLLLGLLLLFAHFGMARNGDASQLMLDMQAYKIQLFGEHSLLKFHNGFSIMMGFLMAAFGLQSLLCAKFITQNKGALLTNLLVVIISVGIAFTYFHVLAYGFILFTTACYTLTALLSARKVPKAKSAFFV